MLGQKNNNDNNKTQISIAPWGRNRGSGRAGQSLLSVFV